MPVDAVRGPALPGARIEPSSASSPARLVLSGAWRLASLADIQTLLDSLTTKANLDVDGSAVDQIDTAAALALLNWLQGAGVDVSHTRWLGFAANEQRVVDSVRSRLAECNSPTPPHDVSVVEQIGLRAVDVARLLGGHLNFLGATLIGIGTSILHPRSIRVRELTAQFEQVCLNAIPVVSLVTLLIGVVVAYLLGLQAEKYGANIFVVDGVGIGATREFAPIIAAVIVAGRSGAAFTAQLGSMRLTEEIDAIRTLGLSPLDVLVLPRVLALIVALPLLVFIGDVMSLSGAMLIAEPMLDITPTTFLARLRENLDIDHVYVGLFKAPVFALAISVIGCRMGMTVERDTRALGMATTSTVVQSIVSVIVLDAAFAVLFQELGI